MARSPATVPLTTAAPSPPLRVAVFSDTALPQMNGVSRTLDRLAIEVRTRGGAVRLFTTTDPAAGEERDVVRFPSRPFWAYPQLRLALPSAASAAAALREWNATLVHAATPFGVGLAGRSAATELGLPFVSSYHTSLSAYARFYRLGALSEPGWAFLRWFHNGGRRTYCPTRAVERELHAHGFIGTRIWSRGVDPVRFSPAWRSAELRARWGAGEAGNDAGRIVVAYVGRLAAEKGLDVLLDGFRRAQAAAPERFIFVFAGDGPYADHCREHAPRGAHFLGQLLGDELSRVYASADLFVFPSTTDTFGNVLLEAMASGLAVVGADAASTREVLGARAGVTFAADEAAALARTLLELAGDPARRAALRDAALATARVHSWEAIFDELVADYRAVIEEHQATRRGDRGRLQPARFDAGAYPHASESTRR